MAFHSNTGFQLSPDFRPRTSSNTSSCGGRLSPIPAMLGEHDWSSPSPFQNSSYSPEVATTGNYSPESLAVNLDQSMKLQPDTYLGYMNGHTPQQPPPPYTAPYESFLDRRDINSMHATSPYGLPQCPIHRLQPCGCMQQVQCKVESMSPSGMSPSYPTEPSPDPLNSQYMYNTRTNIHKPMSNSPPITTHSGQSGQVPSTMMGQLMGTLNSPLLDEFNIDSLDEGIGCNVEEVLKHELNMEGSLEFANFPNFPSSGHQIMGASSDLHATVSHHNPSVQEPPVYSTTATTPSWVH